MPEPILRTERLGKDYGARRAVGALDLDVRRGEIFGFLGPNGAGKTTTIRMLLGLIRPTRGRVLILGRDVARERGAVLPRVGRWSSRPRSTRTCRAATTCARTA